MIYLYRFDLLPRLGTLSDPLSRYNSTALANAGRQVLYGTNYEVPVTLSLADAVLTPGPLQAFGGSTLVFEPVAGISHSGLRLDDEQQSGQLTVRIPATHPVATLYAQTERATQVWLTVAEINGPADPVAPRVLWTGRVRGAAFEGLMCQLTCMHLADILQRPGLTRKHDRQCQYQLGDRSTCRVTFDNNGTDGYMQYREDGFVGSVSGDGLTVVVPAAANRVSGFFNEGVLIVAAEADSVHLPRGVSLPPSRDVAGGIRRTISSHIGDTLTLKTRLPGVHAAGSLVWLFAGCDGLPVTCQGRFDNFANYGGYPIIPIKNPYRTGLL